MAEKSRVRKMEPNEDMTSTTGKIDKSDPRYIAACVKQLPSNADEKEQRIRQMAEQQFLTTPWARDAFSEIRSLQLQYLKEMLGSLNDPDRIHTKTQETMSAVSEKLRSHIVEGKENLEALKGKPVILAANHLGTFKLSRVNPQTELGVNIEGYDMMYPYPLYAAPMYPVAQELGNNLYYTGFDFPREFGTIFDSAGFVPIRPPLEGIEESRVEELATTIREKINAHPNAAIIHFPEGGTSGKRSEKGLYDLERFKTGIFVIASQLGLPIVPVAQFFSPERGFELKVFPPINLAQDMTREEYLKIAERTRQQEQEWINSRREA